MRGVGLRFMANLRRIKYPPASKGGQMCIIQRFGLGVKEQRQFVRTMCAQGAAVGTGAGVSVPAGGGVSVPAG